MELYCWKGRQNNLKNFGDDINGFLWPKLIPKEVYEVSNSKLMGIGTILDNSIPNSSTIHVFGTGAGYGPLPEQFDAWKIHCVRGPLTAKALDLSDKSYVTDPAILLRCIIPMNVEKQYKYGFMPHWRNVGNHWEKICEDNNTLFINPCIEVEEVMNKILSVECLIAESMHGAIVADAFRIPWIPIGDPKNIAFLPFKWFDWTQSMELPFQPYAMPHLENKDGKVTNVTDAIKTLRKLTLKKGVISKENIVDAKISEFLERLNKLISYIGAQ